MATAAQILSVARGQIGYKESPSGSNKTKYNRWYYGSNTSAAWCAIFVCWVFNQCGALSLFPGGKKDAYVPTIADKIISSGRSVGKYNGQAGDIVTFDWNHNNSSDHVGIIEKKNSDGSYTTIEGNTSTSNNSNGGQVMRRKRYPAYISYIYRPPYTASSTASSGTGSGGKLSVDGSWGRATTTKTQNVMGTVQDGIVSGQTKGCKKYCTNCSTESWKFVSGGKGSTVIKAIQKLVGVSRDGLCGPGTIKAIQKLLKSKGYYSGKIDGYMGPATVKGWQKYINSRL